jgi:hypothetical protein
MCLDAVTVSGFNLQYCIYKDDEINEAAVRNTVYALQWIHRPSIKIQLIAVDIDGWAIEFIKNPHPKVRRHAIKQDWTCYELIEPLDDRETRMVKKRRSRMKYKMGKPPVDVIEID